MSKRKRKCKVCKGTGEVKREGMMGEDKAPCTACDGTGDDRVSPSDLHEPSDVHPEPPESIREELVERGQ